MKPFRRFAVVPLICLLLGVALVYAQAEVAGPTAVDTPVFTAEQALLGAEVYRQNCQMCHHAGLQGDSFAATLAGSFFINRWAERPVLQLATFLKTQMPYGAGGSLSDEAYAQVIAFILDFNGYPAGETEFPLDLAELPEGLVFGVPEAEE